MKNKLKNMKRYIFGVLAVLWMAFIFFLSNDASDVSRRRSSVVGWNILSVTEPEQHTGTNGKTPAEPADKPVESQPIAEKPTEEKPVENRPIAEMPTESKPTEKKTAEAAPAEKEATASSQAKPVSANQNSTVQPVPAERGIFGHSPRYFMSDLRKIAHFMLYAVLGILLFLFLSSVFSDISRSLVGSLLIGTLYAVSDEIHQFFVPGRGAIFGDIRLDMNGVTAGLFAVIIVLCIKKALSDRRGISDGKRD